MHRSTETLRICSKLPGKWVKRIGVNDKRQGAARNEIGGFKDCAMGLASAMGRACRKSALSSRYWKSVEAVAGSAHCLSAAGKGRKRGTPCLMITCTAVLLPICEAQSNSNRHWRFVEAVAGSAHCLEWSKERAQSWHPMLHHHLQHAAFDWEEMPNRSLAMGAISAIGRRRLCKWRKATIRLHARVVLKVVG